MRRGTAPRGRADGPGGGIKPLCVKEHPAPATLPHSSTLRRPERPRTIAFHTPPGRALRWRAARPRSRTPRASGRSAAARSLAVRRCHLAGAARTSRDVPTLRPPSRSGTRRDDRPARCRCRARELPRASRSRTARCSSAGADVERLAAVRPDSALARGASVRPAVVEALGLLSVAAAELLPNDGLRGVPSVRADAKRLLQGPRGAEMSRRRNISVRTSSAPPHAVRSRCPCRRCRCARDAA